MQLGITATLERVIRLNVEKMTSYAICCEIKGRSVKVEGKKCLSPMMNQFGIVG